MLIKNYFKIKLLFNFKLLFKFIINVQYWQNKIILNSMMQNIKQIFKINKLIYI